MQARGSHLKREGPRVSDIEDTPSTSFFSDVEDTPSTSNGVGLSVSRENPRALSTREPNQSLDKLRNAASKSRDEEDGGAVVDAVCPSVKDTLRSYGNAAVVSSPHLFEGEDGNPKQDGLHAEGVLRRNTFDLGNGRERASTVHKANIESQSLMPKLQHSDYYIQRALQELAAKEWVL